VERLRESGVIQVVAVADPLKIGYQTYADIQIQVRPPAIDAVATRLAKFREIFFLGICTGTCDLLAGAIFRSNQHMDDFMTKRLAKVPGIERTMTLSFIRIVKRDFAYPVASLDGGTVDGHSTVPRRVRQRLIHRQHTNPRV
jgi:Lrp/AsnC family transcriptional regulator for asnA, asnC and gidA